MKRNRSEILKSRIQEAAKVAFVLLLDKHSEAGRVSVVESQPTKQAAGLPLIGKGKPFTADLNPIQPVEKLTSYGKPCVMSGSANHGGIQAGYQFATVVDFRGVIDDFYEVVANCRKGVDSLRSLTKKEKSLKADLNAVLALIPPYPVRLANGLTTAIALITGTLEALGVADYESLRENAQALQEARKIRAQRQLIKSKVDPVKVASEVSTTTEPDTREAPAVKIQTKRGAISKAALRGNVALKVRDRAEVNNLIQKVNQVDRDRAERQARREEMQKFMLTK